MKKYKILIIILVVIIFFGGLVLLGRLTNKANVPTMILFYGDTCSHCKNVDDYIKANNVHQKLKFRELEVFNNQNNAALLAQTAKQCGFDMTSGVGVPFFFDGAKCLQGDVVIIDFFKAQLSSTGATQ